MRAFRSSVLGGLALIASLLPALAQVNTVPQVGVISNVITKFTYSASSVGLVPAASATDFFCIAGSANKVVKITEIRLSGTTGTAIAAPIVMVLRQSADTGGTLATSIALPVASDMDSIPNPNASAVLAAYTANPTIVDSAPTYIRAGHAGLVVVTGSPTALVWSFGSTLPNFTQPLTLRGANQQSCLNLQATTVTTGSLNITVQWTEE